MLYEKDGVVFHCHDFFFGGCSNPLQSFKKFKGHKAGWKIHRGLEERACDMENIFLSPKTNSLGN